MNLVDLIAFQAKIIPDAIAICAPGAPKDSITYDELARMTNNVGSAAKAHGLSPGQVVAISIKDDILHAIIALGLIRCGIATVSLPNALFRLPFAFDALVTDGMGTLEKAPRVFTAVGGWTFGEGTTLSEPDSAASGESALCRIMLAGPAASPRGIPISHVIEWRRVAQLEFLSSNSLPGASRLFCDLPMQTTLTVLLHVLLKGGTLCYPGDSWESTLQAFGLYKIDTVLSSPSKLAGILALFEAHSVIESPFERIICVDGRLDNELLDRVFARLCNNVLYSYGLPETGPIAFAQARVIADIPGAVGFVLPDTTVQIVDENGAVMPLGQQGRMRIRNPQMALGYADSPTILDYPFRGGWFYPDRLGSVRSDRLLILRN